MTSGAPDRLSVGAWNALEQRKTTEAFLARQLQRFSTVKRVTPLTHHEIRLEDRTPIKQCYRPRNSATQKIINEEVGKMFAEEVIQPSSSPWSSPVVIVRRKDAKPRFCVDFRKLNQVSTRMLTRYHRSTLPWKNYEGLSTWSQSIWRTGIEMCRSPRKASRSPHLSYLEKGYTNSPLCLLDCMASCQRSSEY